MRGYPGVPPPTTMTVRGAGGTDNGGNEMLEVRLVGATTVEHDGTRHAAHELGGVKPRQLLQMLALEPGVPRTKDALAEQLWEGRPPGSWLATVESYVCVLRRRLGVGRGRGSVLATSSSGYVLDPDRVEVDVVGIRQQLAGDPERVATAMERLRGDLLPEEPYAPWACAAREQLWDTVTDAGCRAARAANADGRHELAVRIARVAVEHSYYSEPAWRELIRALWLARGPSEAVHAYERLREGLRTDLGLEPGPETQALHHEILRSGTGAEEIGLLVEQLGRALERTPSMRLSASTAAQLGQLLLARSG